MKDVNSVLERYFQSFINADNHRTFFLGLAEYAQFVDEIPETQAVVADILAKREDLQKRLDDVEAKFVLDANKVRDEIEIKIKKHGLMDDDLKSYFAEYDKFRKKEVMRVDISACQGEEMSAYLMSIINHLRKNGHLDLTKMYVTEKNTYPRTELSYSPYLQPFNELLKEYKSDGELGVWRAWNELAQVYTMVYNGDKEFSKWIDKDFGNAAAIAVLSVEMDKILKESFGYGSDHPIHFKLPKYREYANRFHNYLLKSLLKREMVGDKAEQVTTKKPMRYDRGVLYVNGAEVVISKGLCTDQHYLLQTIMKDPEKLWNNDEIAEDWLDEKIIDDDSEYVGKEKRKFYDIGRAVNKRLEKVGESWKLVPLLNVGMQAISVNKNYL